MHPPLLACVFVASALVFGLVIGIVAAPLLAYVAISLLDGDPALGF